MEDKTINIVHIIYVALIAILIGLSGLLSYEYMNLRMHIQRIAEIQEEYQTYVVAFRKILRDYQRLKEGEEEPSSYEDDEKKEQPFLVVNREPTYLRESTIRYFRKQRMESLFHKVYPMHAEPEPVSITRSRNNRRLRRRSQVRSSGLLNSQLNRHRMLIQGKRLVTDISFAWPLDRSQFWISSFYGARRKPDRSWGFHYGIDMAAIKGTPVKAVAPGVVVEAGCNKGYGNTVVIMHNRKYKSRYAHLHRIYVRVGQSIETGHCIGAVGDTGLVRKRGKYASHLHFEAYVYNKRVNPLYFFV